MWFDNKEIKVHLEGLIKYAKVEPTNLFQLQLQLRKILFKIPCNLPHEGEKKTRLPCKFYEDTWNSITGKEENNFWKDGELVATPTYPGDYTATTIAASGIYEKKKCMNSTYIVKSKER